MDVFYIHFHEAELAQRMAALAAAGYRVRGHWSTESVARFDDGWPDAFVISLDRLPSHGRRYAEWIWQAKKRQHLPIVFVGGKPDKVAATRERLPAARYCDGAALLETLERTLATA